MINCVNGEINSNKLGNTLCHEHIIIDLSKVRNDNDSKLDNIDDMIYELLLAKKLGVNSILEMTNIGMGRDVLKLKEISSKTSINIVASTGFYTIPYYPSYVYIKSIDELAKIMISEIEVGIDNTNIKAGVIGEIGTSFNKIEPIELKIFNAAFIAHKKTGIPIFTHAEIGTMGYEQAIYLKNLGMNMDKLVISHMDLVSDYSTLKKIVDTGANIGFDTIGKESYVSNSKKVEMIKLLIRDGYEDKILLSQDITRLSYLSKNNSFGYTEVFIKFIPLLLENGIEEIVIKKFIVTNIKRIFKNQ